MPSLLAILGLNSAPFVTSLTKAQDIAATAGKRIQAQWAAHSVFLEQQIASGKRAGVSTAEWAAELVEVNAALKGMAAANAVATAATAANTVATEANNAAQVNWRVVGREVLVVLREIGRGNWSRVPGSLSIIAENIGGLTELFSPFSIALAVAGAAALGVAMQMRRLNVEAEEEHSIVGRLSNLWEHQAKAMQAAGERAREFANWLDHLHDRQESAAESTQDGLRALRDEFELRQRIARASGQTPAQARAAEAEQQKKEADFFRDKMYDTSAFANNAEKVAKKREADAVAGVGLKPGELDAMKDQASELARLIKERQEGVEKGPGFWDYARVGVEGGGRVEQELLDEAVAVAQLQDKYKNLIAEIASYEARQKGLDDSAKQARENAEKAEADLQEMKRTAEEKDRAARNAQDSEDYGGGKQLVSGYVNDLQRVGGFIAATNVSVIDVHQKQLARLESIDKKLDTLNKTAREHHAETRQGNRNGHGF